MTAKPGRDPWAAWLGERGHGGDAELLRRQLELLAPIRDRVITNAALSSDKRVLDIGCGDGLIALAAAETVGPAGQVICSDVSDEVLDLCRERAAGLGVLERCSFVKASASDLSPVQDQAVDAVTLRSVLIYEPNKENAFAEFYRVLRPGGRLSLFEPINRFGRDESPDRWGGYDVARVAEIARKLRLLYEATARFQAVSPRSDSGLSTCHVVAALGPKVLKLSAQRSARVHKLFRLVQLEQVAERIVQEGLVAGAGDRRGPVYLDALLLQVGDGPIYVVDSDREVVRTELLRVGLHQVHLLSAGVEPVTRAEIGARQLRHAEHVAIKGETLLRVGDADGDMVHTGWLHRSILPRTLHPCMTFRIARRV